MSEQQDPWLCHENWYNVLLKSGMKIKSSSSEYKILEHFGSSGNGEIFLALTSDQFLVGLKIILQKTLIEKEVEHLRNGNKKLGDIILPYIDYFILQNDQDKYYIIVLKFFEGYIPLSKYLEKNLFHIEYRMKIKNMIKNHMEQIHAKLGIAHNDIDKNKILIHSKNQHIRFFDLGYSIEKFGYTDQEFLKFIQKDFDSIEKI